MSKNRLAGAKRPTARLSSEYQVNQCVLVGFFMRCTMWEERYRVESNPNSARVERMRSDSELVRQGLLSSSLTDLVV